MRRELAIIAALALVLACPLASANRRSSAKSRREEKPAPVSWRFSKEQRERPTGLSPSQELVIKNPVPFTLYSGPRGARRDTKVKAIKLDKTWVATLRPPVGSRWMTFKWHDEPGGRWEGRDYYLEVVPRELRLPKRVVASGREIGIGRFPVRVAVLARGEVEGAGLPEALPGMVQRFGSLVGAKRYALLTGGGRGLPRLAERAAHEQGGETWAVSATRTVDDQLEAVFDASATSVLYPTGSGGGPGAIEREAPLIQLANIRTYWNGRSGTFGELMAGLHEPGVIALLSQSGGIGGNAGDHILPYVGVPETVRVVASRDPDRLFAKADAALADLHRRGVKTEPRAALYRTRPHRSVVSEEQRSKRVIMSFLVDDGGRAHEADRQQTERLIDLALRTRIKGKSALPISRDNALAKQAFLAGGKGGVLVSHERGQDERLGAGRKNGAILLRRTGKGPGVGEFASHREVVEHADVVFVTSAYFKNLSGLAFALRASKPPVIAVLELESTGSRHIAGMSKLMEGEDRFVFDSDPARLIEKAAAKLTEKKKDEKAEARTPAEATPAEAKQQPADGTPP